MLSITLLKKKNYIAMIQNAAKGENSMFRNLYALVDEKEKDIVKNGDLSCAFFLSGVLYINKLIKDMHSGVVGLEKDLLESGWEEINELKEGAILIWEPSASGHLHAGVYIGNDKAVSNMSEASGVPGEHHFTYNNTRKIIRIWWHDKLEEI